MKWLDVLYSQTHACSSTLALARFEKLDHQSVRKQPSRRRARRKLLEDVELELGRVEVSNKMAQVNGTAPETSAPTIKTPAVIGINFGNTYASIAVLTKVRPPFLYSTTKSPDESLMSPGRTRRLHCKRRWRTPNCMRGVLSWRGNGSWSLSLT